MIRRSLKLFLWTAAALIVASVSAKQALPFDGIVTHVRDGDTIVVSGIPVRLKGVTCDELSEEIGLAAKRFMEAAVMQSQVSCIPTGEVSYDRIVGTCTMMGADLGAVLIGSGLCARCPAFDKEGRYLTDGPQHPLRMFAGTIPPYCKEKP